MQVLQVLKSGTPTSIGKRVLALHLVTKRQQEQHCFPFSVLPTTRQVSACDLSPHLLYVLRQGAEDNLDADS